MEKEKRIVELKDFFDFNVKEPINRIAYTKEDMDYKTKVIRKMQELGMEVTIDKLGNICGSISIGKNPKKTLAIGSHTDSVYNGGQYDGPVGVITGLQTVEQLKKNKDCNGIVKVAIYACEESSRFGNSCIGSKYLNGNLTDEDMDRIIDERTRDTEKVVTLREAVEGAKIYLKDHVTGIKEVEKIFEQVDYSLEVHIEQYELLKKEYKKRGKQDIIGIINSVGAAVRVRYEVEGQCGHTGSTPMNKRKNAVDATAYIGKAVRKLGKKYEKQGLGRASQVEINTPNHKGSFNQIPDKAEGLIDFRLLGESTPEQMIQDFEKIVEKSEAKTKTKIQTVVVSKGTPVITSSALNSQIASICEKKKIHYLEMPSYAGQDTGYIPAKQKTMLFIPSTEGSHNPNESTRKKFIKPATKVLIELSQELFLEKFKEKQKTEIVRKTNNRLTVQETRTKKERKNTGR